jgi:hypothetical protein
MPARSAVFVCLISLSLILSSHRAQAVFLSGQDLLSLCTSSDPGDELECVAYISGVADVVSPNFISPKYGSEVCISDATTVGQEEAVVVAYLKQHPESLAHGAETAIIPALDHAYPCPRG